MWDLLTVEIMERNSLLGFNIWENLSSWELRFLGNVVLRTFMTSNLISGTTDRRSGRITYLQTIRRNSFVAGK
jgi:hypothetical protein